MRQQLQKAGALLLALGALGLLMVHAALTHGCSATVGSATPQAPDTEGSGSSSAENPDREIYMGATKAPPLDAFGKGRSAEPPPQQQAAPAQAPE